VFQDDDSVRPPLKLAELPADGRPVRQFDPSRPHDVGPGGSAAKEPSWIQACEDGNAETTSH